jgi:hypothetical protein
VVWHAARGQSSACRSLAVTAARCGITNDAVFAEELARTTMPGMINRLTRAVDAAVLSTDSGAHNINTC